MDLVVWDEHAEDFANTKISVLRPPAKNLLSCMLNTKKCILAPGYLPRDWRGLASLLNCTIKLGYDPTDPVATILDFCEAETTIAHFIRYLQRIDRYDVVEDTKELFIADIIYFKEQCSSANPTPVVPNDCDTNGITFDDMIASNNDLPLPRYDAFLLYDEAADMQPAINVKKKLETEFNLKLCIRNRDIRPGVMFEYQSIVELITERCNWLIIIIVSNDFSNNCWNMFILKSIKSLGIVQRSPKIIPCLFGNSVSPKELQLYVPLFFNKHNPFCDPWHKLRMTVSTVKSSSVDNSVEANNSYQKKQIEKSMNTSTTIVEKKMFSNEEYNCLPESKSVIEIFLLKLFLKKKKKRKMH